MLMKKRLRRLTSDPPVWAKRLGRSDVVTASRVSIPRNLAGRRFPHRMPIDERRRTLDDVRPFFDKRNLEEFSVSEMDGYDNAFLWERGLSLGNTPEESYTGKSFFMDGREKTGVMVNEFDHVWIVCSHAGPTMRTCLEEATRIEGEFASEYELAKNSKDGYLTSAVDMRGTGVRMSVILHVPAITLEARDDFLELVLGADLRASGPFGITPLTDNPPLGGSLIQVYCHSSGEHETAERLEVMEDVVTRISEIEIDRRNNLDMISLDTIGRMWGGLQERRCAEEQDVLAALQLSLLGIWNGIVDEIHTETINKLFYLTLDGHLMSAVASVPAAPDIARANFVRSALKGER